MSDFSDCTMTFERLILVCDQPDQIALNETIELPKQTHIANNVFSWIELTVGVRKKAVPTHYLRILQTHWNRT